MCVDLFKKPLNTTVVFIPDNDDDNDNVIMEAFRMLIDP